MLQSLGGPVMLAFIQMVIALRLRRLGGTERPVRDMNASQLHALDLGYSDGLLWLAGVAVLLIVVALFIGYTAEEVAHAQNVMRNADNAGVDDAGAGPGVLQSESEGGSEPRRGGQG